MKLQKQHNYESFKSWQLLSSLGAGGFGVVLHWCNRDTKQHIATKTLKQNDTLLEDEAHKLKQRWRQEVEWMHDSQVPAYIVKGVELTDEDFKRYLTENHAWRPLPVIVMEYCNGGDVRALLRRPENMNGLSEKEVRDILWTLRKAIEYLHNVCRIEHRDLKPDNILVHQLQNGQRCYKLTDFGFARAAPAATVKQSVVGTRHYFAPEIVETAKYSKTVDYWSMAVIAFELMCGVLPFIPHQNMYDIVTNIRNKPPECIAITEDPQEARRYHFHSHIFAENRLSPPFIKAMEPWLRMALDYNHSSRGTNAVLLRSSKKATDDVQPQQQPPAKGELQFYTQLDSVFDRKLLSVYSLNRQRFYTYEVNAEMPIHDFLAVLGKDTGFEISTFYFVLPSGHHLKEITRTIRPIDLYEPLWLSNAEEIDLPPAMLYVVSHQGPFETAEPEYSSPAILELSELSPCEASQKMPEWVLQQYERQLHYFISNEQRHLRALVKGTQQYAIDVEHAIFQHEQEMQNLVLAICEARGSLQQFYLMVDTIQAQNQLPQARPMLAEWQAKAQGLKEKFTKLETEACLPLQTRYKSALRRIRQTLNDPHFEKALISDPLELNKYRHSLAESHSSANNAQERLHKCQAHLEKCCMQREKMCKYFLQKSLDIDNINKEFRAIQAVKKSALNYLEAHSCSAETTKFLKSFLTLTQAPRNGLTASLSEARTYTSLVSDSESVAHADTKALIAESNRIHERLEELLKAD